MTIRIPIKKKGVIDDAKFDMTGFQGSAMFQDMYIDDAQDLKSFRWEDGDTVYDTVSDEGYRFLGMNAIETDHIGHSDKQGFKSGQYGGELQAKKFYELAKKLGYNRLVTSGKKDVHHRWLADLQNANGESFSTALFSNDLLTPNRWTSEGDRDAYESKHFNSLMGVDTTTSEWAKAKEELDDHFAKGLWLDEFGSPYTKKEALNEWQLREAQINSEIYGIHVL